MRRHTYVGLLCCLLVAGLALPPAGAAEGGGDSLKPFDLHIGFTRASFLGVNEADAMAAFKVFTRTVGERRGYEITPHVRIFDDLATLAAEIESGALALLIVDSWEYLTVSPGPDMPIVFSTVEQGVAQEDYLLLVKAGSTATGLADLEGKRLIALESSSANTGKHWLRTELLSLGVTSPQSFFSRYEVTHKLSQVVLPVFFGQADACVVDRSGFEVMTEMNPQVGKMLAVAARSEPLVDTLIGVRRGDWDDPQYRVDLLDALRELNTDPGGRQILSLFRFNGMAPFVKEDLASMLTLRQRHDSLLAELTADGKAVATK